LVICPGCTKRSKRILFGGFSWRRGSGRDRSGRTAVWGRRALAGWRPWRTTRWSAGVTRLWRIRPARAGALVGWFVDPSGLTTAATAVAAARPGDYAVTQWGPAPVRPGLTTCLRWVPVGSHVCGLRFFARAAGTAIQVLRHRGGFTECRLPSRRTRWFAAGLACQVGTQGDPRAKHRRLRRAGDSFWLGRRPRVRGVAMNPIDHPHGGGQGKTSGGRPGTTPWGRLTKGYKTVRR
jgi:ribosomal protein L2